jgi:opacity protein-like surface antigen
VLPLSAWSQAYVGGAFGAARYGDDADRAWKLFAGYQANRYFSAELSYVDLGRAATVSTGQSFLGPTTTESRTRTKAWELVGIGWLPVLERLSVTGKAGLYRSDVKRETRNSGFPSFVPASQDFRAHNNGFTLGVGTSYRISRGLDVRAEWQRYFGVGDDGASVPETDIDLLSVGLTYRF